MKKSLYILASLTLAFISVIYLKSALTPTPDARLQQPLNSLIPDTLPEWNVKTLPLSSTELGVKETHRRLQFNEYIYREFTRDNITFYLYIAHWKPNQMPAALVQVHTPDKCWSGAGWSITHAQSEYPLKLSESLSIPTEYRQFTQSNSLEYVYYCHSVGDTFYYNPHHRSTQATSLHASLKFGTSQKQEQLFIRINSPFPIETFWNDHTLRPLLNSLEALFASP